MFGFENIKFLKKLFRFRTEKRKGKEEKITCKYLRGHGPTDRHGRGSARRGAFLPFPGMPRKAIRLSGPARYHGRKGQVFVALPSSF